MERESFIKRIHRLSDKTIFFLCFSVNGKRYFDCQPKYGSMVPVTSVTIGDFPPENYDDEL